MDSPTPETIFELRTRLGISQAAAADLVHHQAVSWGQWERSQRRMHAAVWELFTIKAERMLADRTKQPRVRARSTAETVVDRAKELYNINPVFRGRKRLTWTETTNEVRRYWLDRAKAAAQ